MALSKLDWGPTTGEMLGRGLGSGLGEGLQQLAQIKMNEYARRQQQEQNEIFRKREEERIEKNLPGMGWLAGLNPQFQTQELKNKAQQDQAIQNQRFWQQSLPAGTPQEYIQAIASQPIPVQQGLIERLQVLGPNMSTTEGVGQPIFGLTPKEKRAEEVLNLQKEASGRAARGEISKENAPINKYYSDSAPSIEQGLQSALAMKEALESGDIETGIPEMVQKYRPLSTYSQPTQDFITEGNKLVAAEATALRGVPSVGRFKFIAGTKPNIQMSHDEALKQTNDYVEKFSKLKLGDLIRQNEIKKNNGIEPRNLAGKIAEKLALVENSGISFNDALNAFNEKSEPAREQAPEATSDADKLLKEYEKTASKRIPGASYAEGLSTLRAAENMTQENKRQIQDVARQFDKSPAGMLLKEGVGLTSDVLQEIVMSPFDLVGAALNIGNKLTNVVPSAQQMNWPTSTMTKELVGKATGGYTLPESENEQSVRNIVGLAANFLVPNKLAAKGAGYLSKLISPEAATKVMKYALPFSGTKITPKQAAILGIGTEVAGRGARYMGASPLTESVVRLGAGLALATPGTRKNVTRTMHNEYDASANALLKGEESGILLPEKHLANVKPIEDKLSILRSNAEKSASPYKKETLRVLDGFDKAISNIKKQFGKTVAEQTGDFGSIGKNIEGSPTNQLPAQDILRLKRNTNEWILLNEMPYFEGQAYLPKAVRHIVEDVNHSIKDSLRPLMDANPEFAAHFNAAEDIYKGLTDFHGASEWLRDNAKLGKNLKSATTAALFGATLFKGGFLPAVGGASAAVGGRMGAEVIRLLQTAEGSKAYLAAIDAAKNGSIRDFVKNATKLDKIALNQERKNHKSSRDPRKMEHLIKQIS